MRTSRCQDAGALWKGAGLVFALLPLLVLSGCYAPTSNPPRLSAEELKAEEELQQHMIDEAAKMGGAVRPWRTRPFIGKRFVEVAGRMEPAAAQVCQELELPKRKLRCYFYYKTKRGDDINAYADGDRIVFLQGMLRYVENDDELALVMGHEIAHNMMGHLKAKKYNALAGGIVGSLLEGVNAGYGGNYQGLAAEGEIGGALSYSQSFESEADYVGLYITARAGYNIDKAADFWRRFSVEEPQALYIATTHPTNPERAAMINKIVAEIEYKKQHGLPLLPNMGPNKPIEGDYEPKNIFELMLEP